LAACDVVIVGAGPAGSIAGLVLARAGVRVRILDRAAFPRDKLCGDTINPGTLARLRALGVAGEIERRGLRVDGMVVTGERGVAVEGRYPDGLHGRAMLRRDLDALLLRHAIDAGCTFDQGVTVTGAAVEIGRLVGVVAGAQTITAPVTIAADGRRSTIAFSLGLARHPRTPRRWAIGAYYSDVRLIGQTISLTTSQTTSQTGSQTGSQAVGEMHVRRNCYIGVAPVGQNVTNVCLVKPSQPADAELREPAALLTRTLDADPALRDRFVGATMVTRPVILGPLAVDTAAASFDGLILAGDSAGFVDPMTGDGLRFAVRGAELAAAAAIDALAHGWRGVHARLARARRREFRGKQRFNRALRSIVASPIAIDVAAFGARLAPGVMRAIIARAGDCHLAGAARAPDDDVATLEREALAERATVAERDDV
jgi:menaquinone-9 beta-reductase